MKISIFGLGYVGSTTMACLAELGHEVVGTDPSGAKVDMINAGKSPMVEPGLSELLAKHRSAGRIHATMDAKECFKGSEACFVCVGTPPAPDGFVDYTVLEKVILQIADMRLHAKRTVPVLVRSTALPVVHRDMINSLVDRLAGRQNPSYVVHPEFLREGYAIADFFAPPKVVFGCTGDWGRSVCEGLYPDLNAPVIFTDPMTAALAKYADNCFHAVKVTFANEVSALCRGMAIDPRPVMDIFCQDRKLNISPAYLRPGFAYGGSCLGKDLQAMGTFGRRSGIRTPMLDSVPNSNLNQITVVTDRITATAPKAVGLFGLAFKERTDDIRDSPLVTLGEQLHVRGVRIRIFDPAVAEGQACGTNMEYALRLLPSLTQMLSSDVECVLSEVDVVVVSRPFPEISWKDLPWRPGMYLLDLHGGIDFTGVPVPVYGLYW